MTSSPRWPGLRRAFRLPFSRDRIGVEVDDELHFHIEGRIEQFVAAGMTRQAAEAEARQRFGDYHEYRRQAYAIDERTMRTHQRLELSDTLRRETRHAVRSLLRTPSFSFIALFTLALGIAATTAIFSILETLVLRPLPYANAGQLVSVLHPATVPGSGEAKWGLSSAGYFFFRRETRTLANLGVYTTGYATVSGDGDAERARAGYVTHTLLQVLGGRPAVGRLIGAEEDQPRGPSVVMLGHDFWQRRYAGDRGIIGRVIATSHGPMQVIGVTEKGFNLPKPAPFESGNDLAGFRVDLWFPLQLDAAARAQNSHPFAGVGRLRPGATVEAAQRELQALTVRLPETFPTAYSPVFMKEYDFRMGVQPLRDAVIGETVARALWVLFAAVGLVLLIACANVANLFLVRMEARRREAAIRSALGADGRRLAVHYLSESLLLSLFAGALAVALTALLLRALLVFAPSDLPRLSEVRLRWSSVGFAALVSIASGIVFGIIPLFRRGLDLATLRESGRGATTSRRQRGIRDGLVIGQVALSVLLLAAAGLMARSFAHLRAVEPGIDSRGVLTFGVALPDAKYDSYAKAAAFHRELQTRLAALPGVERVGAASGLPLRDLGNGCALVFREARPYAPGEEPPCVAVPRVTPGFFEALKIRVEGRVADWSDHDAGTGAVVVTRALADRLWPGEDPIGKGINSSGAQPGSGFYRVTGVVPSLRAVSLEREPTEAVFYPPATIPKTWLWGPLSDASYVVRTTLADPVALTPAVRAAVAEIDPTVAIANPTTMDGIVERSMARVSFILLLLGAAAAIGVLLSAVGIYGVISYLVGQRRPEIGVRVALGASVSQVARLVVMQSVRLAVLGVMVGLVAAVLGTRVMASLLFGVSPTDPAVLAMVALALIGVATAASFAPARRAARIDPVEALRAQ